MVSGTLNNSNFYSFKSYWIFGILVKVSKFQNSILSNIQTFKLPKLVGSLKV